MRAVDKQKITRLQIIKYAKIKFLQRSTDNRIANPINFGARCRIDRCYPRLQGMVIDGAPSEFGCEALCILVPPSFQDRKELLMRGLAVPVSVRALQRVVEQNRIAWRNYFSQAPPNILSGKVASYLSSI